ncbi:hypothetical protein SteCoe_5567 [Stentor coeruleus]|uniref:Uncharacterized protein n=1 Tax=Stentor coeruleus TaxID=5963 RepID=A0A1R2CRZ3_9CILI|nr:hypothetical protein SteCoe_5567 [Stentor coeruleus]
MLCRILARRSSIIMNESVSAKFKGMKKISEVYEFLEANEKTPAMYSLAARTLGIILNANQKDYEDTISIEASKFFSQIEKFDGHYSVEDISYIAFLLRTQRQFRFAKFFSSDFETKIVTRLSAKLNANCNKDIIINAYHNLGYLEKMTSKCEKVVQIIIQSKKQFFKNEEYIKLLQGAYYSKTHTAKSIIIDVLKQFENSDIQIISNKYLSEFLKIMLNIDSRYDCGYKVLNIILETLLSRAKYLSVYEIDLISEFYSLTDDYDLALFYEALHTLEKKLSNEEIIKKNVLSLISSFGKIVKRNKNIRISKHIIDSLIHKLSEKVDYEKVGYLEFTNALINMSPFYDTLPESIENIVNERAIKGYPGLWVFKIINGVLGINNCCLDKFFSMRNEFINSIKTSSIKVKLEMIQNITNTKNYHLHPQLVEMLQLIKSECLSKTNGWKNVKYFLWAFIEIKNEISIDHIDALLIISLKELKSYYNLNTVWFNVKALLILHNSKPEIYNIWKEVALFIGSSTNINHFPESFKSIYESHYIESLLELSDLLNIENPESLAHIFSLNIKNPPDYIIDKTIELLNKTSGDFILASCFDIKKNSLITHIFKTGKGSKIQSFIDRIPSLINNNNSSANVIQLVHLLGKYNFLTQEIVEAVASFIEPYNSHKELCEMIKVLNWIPGKIKNNLPYLNKLITFDEEYNLNLLQEKIDTYLSLPFSHDKEQKFLDQIKNKLENIERKNALIMLDILDSLDINNKHHTEFISQLFKICSEFVYDNIEYWLPSFLIKALIVFMDKYPNDENLIKRLEEKTMNFDFATVVKAKLIKSYMKNGRQNIYLDILCDKFQSRHGVYYAKELISTYEKFKPDNKKVEKLINELREILLNN